MPSPITLVTKRYQFHGHTFTHNKPYYEVVRTNIGICGRRQYPLSYVFCGQQQINTHHMHSCIHIFLHGNFCLTNIIMHLLMAARNHSTYHKSVFKMFALGMKKGGVHSKIFERILPSNFPILENIGINTHFQNNVEMLFESF